MGRWGLKGIRSGPFIRGRPWEGVDSPSFPWSTHCSPIGARQHGTDASSQHNAGTIDLIEQGGSETRYEERTTQGRAQRLGAALRQARRPHCLPARDPHTDPGCAAQPARKSNRALTPLRLTNQARRETAAPAALAGLPIRSRSNLREAPMFRSFAGLGLRPTGTGFRRTLRQGAVRFPGRMRCRR
jgi:hypothetical protein